MGFHNSAVVVVGGQEAEIAAAERSIHAEGRGGGEAAMWPGQDFHRCSAASLQREIWASAEVLCVEGSLHTGEEMKICYVAPTLQIAWRGSQLTQPAPNPGLRALIRSKSLRQRPRKPRSLTFTIKRISKLSRCWTPLRSSLPPALSYGPSPTPRSAHLSLTASSRMFSSKSAVCQELGPERTCPLRITHHTSTISIRSNGRR